MDGTGNEFMEHTRYKYLGISDQQKGVPQPPLELECTDAELTIELPDPLSCKQKPVSVTDAIEKHYLTIPGRKTMLRWRQFKIFTKESEFVTVA